MTITYEEFLEQLAALYAYGLPQKDEYELVYWFRTIQSEGLTRGVVELAVMKLTREQTQFWDSDNIPAMIIKCSREIESQRQATALKDRFLIDCEREKDEDRKALESWGGSEGEAEANQEKTRELIRKIYQ